MFDIFRNVNSIYELGAEQINYGEVVLVVVEKSHIEKRNFIFHGFYSLAHTHILINLINPG